MLLAVVLVFWGCAAGTGKVIVEGTERRLSPGTIVSGATGEILSPEKLFEQLADQRVIYIGEQHNRREHHAVQLELIREVGQQVPDLSVGMEMFARTYQERLDRWSAGGMDEDEFIEQVHWYANWRYDFSLYREILEHIRAEGIPLYGLNLPFHIPSKIATGGLESLLPEDRRHLPEVIDTTHAEHREYLREVFQGHHAMGRTRFDFFYEAQCAWEDTMASSVAENLGGTTMVVLAGSGHIRNKFGIPERAYSRVPVPYATVMPVSVGNTLRLEEADYFWVTK
jgi:uncharacterized iron-regulated protein